MNLNNVFTRNSCYLNELHDLGELKLIQARLLPRYKLPSEKAVVEKAFKQADEYRFVPDDILKSVGHDGKADLSVYFESSQYTDDRKQYAILAILQNCMKTTKTIPERQQLLQAARNCEPVRQSISQRASQPASQSVSQSVN